MNYSALNQHLPHKSKQISTIKDVVFWYLREVIYYKKNYKNTTKIFDIDSKNWYLIYMMLSNQIIILYSLMLNFFFHN